ncbi:hypothetical protein ACIOHC_36240 [Streptomyces sp. NPDC088252]|uniref:hypothetical protein n=1 Tax=Streptomyces sp. NPDC088252 TaxID=3365845 RepID=UPI0038215C8F
MITLAPGDTVEVQYTDAHAHLRERLDFRIVREAELRDSWQARGERQGVAVQEAKIRVLEDVIKELDRIQGSTQP